MRKGMLSSLFVTIKCQAKKLGILSTFKALTFSNENRVSEIGGVGPADL